MRRSTTVTFLLLLSLACNAPIPPWSDQTATPSNSPSPIPPTPLVPTPTSNGANLVSGVDIVAVGSDAFLDQTEAALLFLQGCAPDALTIADEFVSAIYESDRSGMMVEEGTFLASETTAFAPGYSQPVQVYWFAGSLVHDARHRWQSQAGTPTSWDSLPLEQREAIESDARAVQIDMLERCLNDVPAEDRGQAEFLLQYLKDMQAGIIPCDYCEVEWADRDW